jgi:hypothetical protein
MDSNRRKDERLGLAIPVRVQGYQAGGTTWEELSTTIDVSQRGASFALNHPLELGHVLRLTLALPKRLRSYDMSSSAYRVFTLVRFVERRSDRPRVGVLFFGQYPPRGFQEHPEGRYLLPGDAMPKATAASSAAASSSAAKDVPAATGARPAATAGATPGDPVGAPSGTPAAPLSPPQVPPAAPVPGAPTPDFLPTDGAEGADRRIAPRIDVFVNFMLQLTDAQGAIVQQELTVADNISRGGARVMTTLPFHVGDQVLLQEAGGAFATRAEIRGISRVQPAFDRLHLRFMDRQAPDRLLR